MLRQLLFVEARFVAPAVEDTAERFDQFCPTAFNPLGKHLVQRRPLRRIDARRNHTLDQVSMAAKRFLANRSGSTVTQQTYNGGDTDEWVIDDHNGHFKIVNKATGLALKSPSSSLAATITTGSYAGADNTDWDIFATDALD